MFQFGEGAPVALKADNPKLGLAAGSAGTVWAQYDTQPPAYEVTFQSASGEPFDALMYGGELTQPPAALSLLAFTDKMR